MIALIFPDGAVRAFDTGTTGRQVAAAIAPSLARRAVLVKLDGELRDLERPLERGGRIEFLTRESPEALPVLRHDASHVMAEAVQALFPGTQVAIGPPIEDGWYYDFGRDEPFSLEDLPRIEAKMREIIARAAPFTREVVTREAAIARFEAMGETYKAEIIRDLPEDAEITVYHQGGWQDLCKGPHLPSTGLVGRAFKLTKLAGAYWRGDPTQPQLQRIYGAAWASQAELDAHLLRIEEAEKRDHRRVGRAMDLFHMQEEGQGMVFWHPHGWTLYRTLESYIRRRLEAAGYQEIRTPQLLDRALWERSGHWGLYGKNMFVAETVEGETLAVKPMNCPGHVQVFNVGQTSYRDLPLRLAEFGSCHRYEPSGSLHGLMRVRQFVQDDAHIFCREDQVVDETRAFVELLRSVYADLDMPLTAVKFSTRPPEKAGTDEMWDMAEAALARAAEAAGITLDLDPGEGAFYGPKLDFSVKDAIGRTWQLGTLQLDPNLPLRLGAEYIAKDGAKTTPLMLHRAILGSFERFLGILIENHAGAFPLWLAPVQVAVATITSDAQPFALAAAERLRASGLRVETDFRNETINYKVREHSLVKTPVIAVVGRKEAETGRLALRRLGSTGQEIVALDAAAEALARDAMPPDLARASTQPERSLDAMCA